MHALIDSSFTSFTITHPANLFRSGDQESLIVVHRREETAEIT